MKRGRKKTFKLKDVKRRHVAQIFAWCVKRWGKSKYNSEVPTVVVFHSKSADYLASYNEVDHRLRIDIKSHSGLIDLIATIIHEYTHYKQNVKKNYNRMLEKHGYFRHPYEKSANKKARKYKITCLKHFLKTVNK